MQQSSQQLTKQQPFIPLQLSVKYYTKWDCQIQTKSTPNGYFKCLQGKGQVQFTNGNKYTGHFHNGLMNGQGHFIWTNGMKYTGPFVNNAITGIGMYQWQDGSWYKGALLNGKRHGKGEYFCSKDNSKYNGEWQQGLRHGHGLLQFNQEASYEGQFSHGFRHGKGKMKYASGNTYQGEWKNDKKFGFGVMNWFNESQKYEGEWKDDLQHGIGTYYWFDGKIEYKIIKNIYKGNWMNGERHGFGSFFYSNGCRYEGYFAHNKKDGEGLAMDQNGNIKLQCFQKDKLQYTIPDGNTATNPLSKQSKEKKQSLLQKKPSQKKLQTTANNKQPQNLQQSQSTSSRAKLLPSVHKSKNNNLLNTTNLQQSVIVQQPKQQFPVSQKEKQQKLKVEENIYLKCLDIPFIYEVTQKSTDQQSGNNKHSEKFMISEQIANLILRENSHLRQWYKYCSSTSSALTTNTNNNNNCKDFYSGVTVDSLFKLIKDLKIMDQFTTIPKINRQFFYLGWKSTYDINLPNPKKLQFIKQHLQQTKQKINTNQSTWQKQFNNEEYNYSNIQWVHYAHFLQNPQQSNQKQFQSNIDLNLFQDIHNHKKIILYRHFVTYLLRIAYLQTLKIHINKNYSHTHFQKQFRHHLQKLFKTINILYDTVQKQQKGIQSNDNLTFVSKQRAAYNISEEFSKLNQELFVELTKNYQNLHNFSDNTIYVKVLFQILEKFEILKQSTEKILFLQKIQRFMEPEFTKNSLLRKELKAHFSSIQKVIYTSPYFHRILSYQLIQKEFEQLLYLAVNRKITSISKQQSIKKYRQVVDKMIVYVKNSSMRKQKGQNIKLKINLPRTEKDRLKQKLIQSEKQRQETLKQAQRKNLQLQQQQIERSKMQKEDFRWEQNESQSSQQYFD